MMEMFGKVAQNEVVAQALGYVVAVGVYALGAWLVKRVKARMPAEMVDRMWDGYLHDAARWAWREVRTRLDSGEVLTAGWKARVVAAALRQMEVEWNRYEDKPLSAAQLSAARGELEGTVEKARHG